MKEFKIGRYPSNDVVINDKTVSKFHAVLYVEGNTIIINDLNSKNGIYVNGSRIHGSATLNELDIVRLGSALFQWKEYIHKPQVRITDPPTKPYSPPNPPYQPPYSPIPITPPKQPNFTPVIIFVIVIAFFGLGYIIIDSNDKGKEPNPPVSVDPKPKEEPVNETKVEPVKPESAPKPQMILLKHAEYEFYDSKDDMSYFSNVFPVMDGKYAFEFSIDYVDADKYTYYETARDEAASILTLYSNEARETIVVQITGNKSFKVIDGNSWIYKKNRKYQEYLGPGC